MTLRDRLNAHHTLARIREHLPRTAEKIVDQGGFLTAQDVRLIAPIDELRLELLLVRCNCGRILCAAQDVEHFVAIVDESGRDHVRDVSLPAGGEA